MKKLILLTSLFLFSFTLSAQLNIVEQANVTYSQTLNDCWGYEAAGREYALIGHKDGVNVLDITNPASPVDKGTATGANSTWRDIKTFGEYAYVINESSGGLMVIDLGKLPSSLTPSEWSNWAPNIPGLGTLSTCHNIYIDENGYGYLTGCNLNNGGPLYIDLFTTPGTPIYVDKAPAVYAHDVYVRDNILYNSEIYNGQFTMYDISDKSNSIFLGSSSTPSNFTHNAWPNDAGDVVFTTDEVGNAPVAAYDVSDPGNISPLDQFKPLATIGTGVTPHNVHVKDDYVVTSFYTDGVIIIDGSAPDNLIEVGSFDTHSNATGGFGAWGAYPFFSSGTIIVTDGEAGAFILTPTYVRSARLEGVVTDASNGQNLIDVDVSINSNQTNSALSDVFGEYKTGNRYGWHLSSYFFKSRLCFTNDNNHFKQWISYYS